MRSIYVLFEDSGFNFNPNDQTLEYHSFPKIKNQRRVLVENYMRAAKLEASGGSASVKSQINLTKTFDISELMEDDFNFN